MSETKQPDAFDEQPFYELMQQYRCGPALPLSRTIDAFEAVKDFARAELATLREERDALLADAERYRFLKSDAYECVLPFGQTIHGSRTGWITHIHPGATFDEAIDAARAAIAKVTK